ncbi:MAG: exopolysaccharide biosynthesis polyprenyl glycosylphosphotransferase [Candidatus Omnitrophica bacterium]|nr:exopolysaccharide biosynthesis polyprenyl glycosylphosphotransferase [Candidatus Omnitrophota bacterium]
MAISDISCVFLAGLLSYFLSCYLISKPKVNDFTADIFGASLLYFMLCILLIYPFLFYIFGLYEITKTFRKAYTITCIILINFLFCAIFLIISRIFPIILPTKYILYSFLIFSTTCLFLHKMVLFKYVFLPAKESVNILFIGTDILSKQITERLKGSGYSVAGVLENKNLETLIQSKKIKVLVLALDYQMPLDVAKKIYEYNFKGIEVCRSDYFYEVLTRKFAISYYLANKNSPFPSIMAFSAPIFKNTKRLIDFFGSLLGLLFLLPVCLVIIILIKATSEGPIFYFQERIGFQENPFKLIKFRTMVADAEKSNGPQWTTKNDNRVTKVGSLLRRTKLDELPQLINILKGELSFVGPRPIRRHFAQLIEDNVPFYSIRFSVKPGITGWAQVNYDYGGSIEEHIEKFQYDLYYIKYASLFLDLFIMVKTLQTLICGPKNH